MAQQFIIVGTTGGTDAAAIINGNFSELYGALQPPVKLNGVNVNTQQPLLANSKVIEIDMSGTAGAPLVRIGLTPNGQEILPDTLIGNSQPVEPGYYSQNGDTLYFTVTGGTISVRMVIINNYY